MEKGDVSHYKETDSARHLTPWSLSVWLFQGLVICRNSIDNRQDGNLSMRYLPLRKVSTAIREVRDLEDLLERVVCPEMVVRLNENAENSSWVGGGSDFLYSGGLYSN